MVVFSINVHAQLQQFNEYSTGWLEYNTTLYNQDKDVVGYVLIYNKGLNDDKTKINQEYVLLDNNLNKITNGDFDLTNNKGFTYNLYEVKLSKGKLDILYSITKDKSLDFYGYLNTTIDVKSKEIITKKRFDNESITAELVKKEFYKKGKLYKGYNKHLSIDIIPSTTESYFITTNLDNCLYFPELDKMTIYNSNFEKVYSIGELKNSNNLEFQFGKIQNDKISMYINHNKFKLGSISQSLDEGLQMIDAKTGQLIYKVPYNAIKGEYAIPIIDQIENQLVVTGEIKKSYDTFSNYVETFDLLGIRRTLVDVDGKIVLDKKVYMDDIIKSIETETKKCKYLFKKVFNHNDFSFSVILEQSNETWMTYGSMANFLIVDFDKDGNLIRSVLVDKNLSNMGGDSSLLISQSDPESKEIVFYFYDNEKSKYARSKFITFNKYKDGILTQEKKDIYTDDTKTKIYPQNMAMFY